MTPLPSPEFDDEPGQERRLADGLRISFPLNDCLRPVIVGCGPMEATSTIWLSHERHESLTASVCDVAGGAGASVVAEEFGWPKG